MWVAKIKLNSEKTLIGQAATRNKLNLFIFPISYHKEKNYLIVQITGTIFGREKEKDKFVKELKKERRIINLELNEDFFVGIIKEPLYTEAIYNRDIIHISPIFISEKNYEILNIGSFQREKLMKIARLIEKIYHGELISVESKKIKSISVMKVHPELTEKQKDSIELAIKKGYYHTPRKIDLKTLARISGLSFSTYQVHLRKAEGKIIPYNFE